MLGSSPLKHEFNNSVLTLHETRCLSIIKTSWLMQFKETVAVYYENRTINKSHFVAKMHSFLTLNKVVHIVTAVL
jgi:hypothetical protein